MTGMTSEQEGKQVKFWDQERHTLKHYTVAKESVKSCNLVTLENSFSRNIFASNTEVTLFPRRLYHKVCDIYSCGIPSNQLVFMLTPLYNYYNHHILPDLCTLHIKICECILGAVQLAMSMPLETCF